jgi:hypothetical protein
MGSLLNGYFKQRDLRSFARNQGERISCQLNAVDEQVHRILTNDYCSRGELARSTYLQHYVIGVLDSLTSFYERETRRRLGLELYREIFVGYFRDRFHVSRHEADDLFHAASASASHKNDLILDGYTDGLDALRGGRRVCRLLNHFSRAAAPASDSPSDIPKLVAVAG